MLEFLMRQKITEKEESWSEQRWKTSKYIDCWRCNHCRTSYPQVTSKLVKIGTKPVGVSIAFDRADDRSLDDPISSIQAVASDFEIPFVSYYTW